MKVVAGTEDLVGSDDDGRQAVLGDHMLHQRVALGFGDGVGILERGQGKVFVDRAPIPHPVDAR